MTQASLKKSKKAKPPKVISDEEVARFLKHLAGVYRDKRTGNVLLADALIRVAGKLGSGSLTSSNIPKGAATGSDSRQLALEPDLLPLEKFSAEDVTRFVSDESKTKAKLIELAGARFGIPRSALLSLTAERVRAALRSALQHEASIAVIGAEASRYGARRQS